MSVNLAELKRPISFFTILTVTVIVWVAYRVSLQNIILEFTLLLCTKVKVEFLSEIPKFFFELFRQRVNFGRKQKDDLKNFVREGHPRGA